MAKNLKHFVIIGAGISGLSAAFYLRKNFTHARITIFDQKMRAGGWMHTSTNKDYRFEEGPRFFKGSKSPDLLELILDAGLKEEVVAADNKCLRRYIYADGKLNLLPRNPISFLASPLTRGTLLHILREFFVSKNHADDETIDDFIRRRFGSEKLSLLFDSFVSGIFAGDTKRMSMRASFPILYEMEKEHGSILRGLFNRKKSMPSDIYKELPFMGLFTLEGGMSTLVQKLKKETQAEFRLGEKALSIDCMKKEIDGIPFDHLIVATSSKDAAELLPVLKPLKKIRTHSLHLVNMGFDQKLLKQKAFGYLVPPKEKERVLGCAWDSSIYPLSHPKGEVTRLGVMMGGAHHPEIDDFSDDTCIEIAKDAILRHMGIKAHPEAVTVIRAKGASAEYGLGHERLIEEVERELPNWLSLTGNYLEGIAVTHCIKRSKKVVDSVN